MRAEVMMKEYNKKKLELQVLEIQLHNFRGVTEEDMISTMFFSHPEGEERVQTSGTSDKTARVAMNYRKVMERENDDWYDFLLKKYEKVKEEIEFFEDSITRLSGDLPEIVMELLDKDVTWDTIAEKHHVSRTMISNYRKKAIVELNSMYEMREKYIADYMLS